MRGCPPVEAYEIETTGRWRERRGKDFTANLGGSGWSRPCKKDARRGNGIFQPSSTILGMNSTDDRSGVDLLGQVLLPVAHEEDARESAEVLAAYGPDRVTTLDVVEKRRRRAGQHTGRTIGIDCPRVI